jgi:hypothetical protein
MNNTDNLASLAQMHQMAAPQNGPSSKQLAYGNASTGTDASTYRLERGAPFRRAGRLVYATPQFKALTFWTQSPKSVQIAPTKVGTTTNTVNQYPISGNTAAGF